MVGVNFTRRQAFGLGIGTGVAAVALGALSRMGSPGLDIFGQGEAQRERAKAALRGDAHRQATVDAMQTSGMVAPSTKVAGLSASDLICTNRVCHVRYTLFDASMLNGSESYDDLYVDWDGFTSEALVCQLDSYAAIYEFDDESDAYVIKVDDFEDDEFFERYIAGIVCRDDMGGRVIDGCDIDIDHGLVYVPKSAFSDLYDWSCTLQMCCAVNVAKTPESDIDITVVGDVEAIGTREEHVHATGYDFSLSVPVVDANVAPDFSVRAILCYLDGFDYPLYVDGNDQWYDPMTGRVTIKCCPLVLSKVTLFVLTDATVSDDAYAEQQAAMEEAKVMGAIFGPRLAFAIDHSGDDVASHNIMRTDDSTFWPWGYMTYRKDIERAFKGDFLGAPNGQDTPCWHSTYVGRVYEMAPSLSDNTKLVENGGTHTRGDMARIIRAAYGGYTGVWSGYHGEYDDYVYPKSFYDYLDNNRKGVEGGEKTTDGARAYVEEKLADAVFAYDPVDWPDGNAGNGRHISLLDRMVNRSAAGASVYGPTDGMVKIDLDLPWSESVTRTKVSFDQIKDRVVSVGYLKQLGDGTATNHFITLPGDDESDMSQTAFGDAFYDNIKDANMEHANVAAMCACTHAGQRYRSGYGMQDLEDESTIITVANNPDSDRLGHTDWAIGKVFEDHMLVENFVPGKTETEIHIRFLDISLTAEKPYAIFALQTYNGVGAYSQCVQVFVKYRIWVNTALRVRKVVDVSAADGYVPKQKTFNFVLHIVELEDVAEMTIDGNTFVNGDCTFSIDADSANPGEKLFKNLMRGWHYTLTEVADHEADAEMFAGTTVSNSTGVLTPEINITYLEEMKPVRMIDDKSVENKEVLVVATNRYTKEPKGSLKVMKTVSGEGADTSKQFTFRAVVRNGSEEVLNESFKLKHGQSKTFAGLPVGATYTVSETPDDAYKLTWTGETGTIVKDQVAEAKAENARKVGSIKITKVVKGDDASFAFTLTLSEGTTVKRTEKFNLSNGQSKLFENIPSGWTYKVEETSANGYAVSWDKSTEGAIQSDVTLELTATNTREFGSLRVHKTAEDSDRAFSFTVTFSEGSTVKRTEDFTLRHGESKLFENIPVGWTYDVVEAPVAGYYAALWSGAHGTITKNSVAEAHATNTRQYGSLVVDKVVKGGDTSTAFSFTVYFSEDGTTKRTETFKLKSGESKRFDKIPVGWTYVVEEAHVDNYVVSWSGNPGQRGSIASENAVAHATATNTLQEGTLRITKDLSD